MISQNHKCLTINRWQAIVDSSIWRLVAYHVMFGYQFVIQAPIGLGAVAILCCICAFIIGLEKKRKGTKIISKNNINVFFLHQWFLRLAIRFTNGLEIFLKWIWSWLREDFMQQMRYSQKNVIYCNLKREETYFAWNWTKI